MAIIGVLPNTLTNGTTADATQVMADFNKIVNDVNANAAPLANTALLNATNSFTMVQTGINAASAANFPTAQQVQNNMAMGSDVGSSNSYVINPVVPMSQYGNGQLITVFGTQAMNGGAATLAVSGLAANNIVNPNGTSLSSAQIPKGSSFTVVADSTNNKFWLQNSVLPSLALSSDLVTGTSTIIAITPNALRVGAGFSAGFTSPQQTITAGGALTIAHGLGRIPVLVQCLLVNLTAEAGYNQGDIVLLNVQGQDMANARGCVVVPDATNLNVRFGSAAASFSILRKDNGNAFGGATNANWAFVVRAWA